MRRIALAAVLTVVACAYTISAEPPDLVVEGKREILYLHDLANPKRWGPSECTVQASKDLKAEGRPTIHVHMPVDHHGGEKKYPIGWPRMYLTLRKPGETQWGEWERFEFFFYARMSRDKPPAQVATFHFQCPDKHHATYHRFRKIELEKWLLIATPVGKIKDLDKLARLGFNIAESNYKDGDKLDFYLGGFRLTRSAEFAVRSLKFTNNAVFKGQPKLKVEIQVTGPPAKISRGVPFTIRQGETVIRRETLPVKVGLQTMEIDISELKLAPGAYALIAFDGDKEREKRVEFRVVETPWRSNR